MKISIVVPVYNCADAVARCVESIVNQNYEELEIILVDDHSTDNSYSICAGFEEAYSNIRLYKTDGKGVSDARNTGLANATGDVIGFCDADDIYAPDMLCRVSEKFAEDPDLLMVITGYFCSAAVDGAVIPREKFCLRREKLCKAEELFELVVADKRIMGSVWNKFYRRSGLTGCSFRSALTHCEDMHFNAQVLLQNRKAQCAVIPEPLYHYIYTQNSATNCADKIFDASGESRYVVAMHEIARLKGIGRKELELIRYNIVRLSIDALRSFPVEGHRREKLLCHIEDNKRSFLWIAIRNIGRGGCKWLIKYFLLKLK